MKKIFIILFLLISFTGEVFAMNQFAQIAVNLKQKGYRQDIVPGDTIYSVSGDEYISITKDISSLPASWVKVPQTVEIMNEVIGCQYMLGHSSTSDGRGGYKETWSLNDGVFNLSNENIWVVMSNYWMMKKGK